MQRFVKNLFLYLNPIKQLGKRKYSSLFPLITIVLCCIFSEVICYGILKNPNAVGAYIIFVTVALTIYFAFHDGLRGGFIVSTVTIIYYFYIVYSRHYKGAQFSASIDTIIILGVLYFILGGIIGWLKQTIDKLIEQEADEKRRLEAILEQLPVGIIITNSKGVVKQSNKRLDKILGIKMPKGLIAGKDMAIRTEQNNKQIKASQSPLAQALATGKTVTNKEFSIIRPDGKPTFINVGASVIRNNSGKIIAAASIINDITHQKQLEERKDDFVNMASHELKTPITSMKLYIESLTQRIKKTNDPSAIKTIESIKYQTNRLQALVSDLLDVTRLQTGKLSMRKEEFVIDDLIQETIDTLQHSTKNQKIILFKKNPITLYADKFRIDQVFTNLITNAVKYSHEGSKIHVYIKKDHDNVIIQVQDFGIGISKEEKGKIFERLYQVIDTQEKTFPGLGMGLYISKEIIKKHKGKIWVESEKDKGSSFYFSLPIKGKK